MATKPVYAAQIQEFFFSYLFLAEEGKKELEAYLAAHRNPQRADLPEHLERSLADFEAWANNNFLAFCYWTVILTDYRIELMEA